MNELTVQTKQLPDTIEDVAKFAIFAEGRLKVLKAEISAINQLGLAKEVYEQKMQESRDIGELVLEAYKKIGEFSSQLKKASGGDRRSENFKSSSGATFEKPKEEIMRDLGFSKDQTRRMEILAKNPDVVEQVKQEAREQGTIPTRSRVIDLVERKEKIEQERENKAIAVRKRLNSVFSQLLSVEAVEKELTDFLVSLDESTLEFDTVHDYVRSITRAIQKLEALRSIFVTWEAKYGKKTASDVNKSDGNHNV